MLSKVFKSQARGLNRWFSTSKVVTLEYSDLTSPKAELHDQIAEAYGPDGYGLLLVKNIPTYTELRTRLLLLNYDLAHLPEAKLKKLVKPEYHYGVGFSRGVEKFKGKPDFSKGSFYANPQLDETIYNPQNPSEVLVPGNVWPKEDLPEYEYAFKDLGRLVVGVGERVAGVVDKYVEKALPGFEKGKIQRIIRESKTCKARGLLYYPMTEKPESDEGWCGWHNDHGTLTGLCSALYLDKNRNITTMKDENTGLFVCTRKKDIVRVQIPPDMLAFQIGESAQIHTGGLLRATPHAVRVGEKLVGTGISRSTLAVFMQPSFNEDMNLPQGKTRNELLKDEFEVVPKLGGRYSEGMTFIDFHNKTLQTYMAEN